MAGLQFISTMDTSDSPVSNREDSDTEDTLVLHATKNLMELFSSDADSDYAGTITASPSEHSSFDSAETITASLSEHPSLDSAGTITASLSEHSHLDCAEASTASLSEHPPPTLRSSSPAAQKETKPLNSTKFFQRPRELTPDSPTCPTTT